MVSFDEIEKNEFNLNLSRYIRSVTLLMPGSSRW
jgi:hypothetical protein